MEQLKWDNSIIIDIHGDSIDHLYLLHANKLISCNQIKKKCCVAVAGAISQVQQQHKIIDFMEIADFE